MSERVVLKPGITVAVGEHHYNISQVLEFGNRPRSRPPIWGTEAAEDR